MKLCYEQKFPVVIYDEAGDFSRRGAMTQFNRMLNRTFETFRAFKILVVIVLPNFMVLDNELLDKHIPRLLLHLKDRTIYSGEFYGYSLYRILLLKSMQKKMNMKHYSFRVIVSNIQGRFYDLDTERSKILDDISTHNKMKILSMSEIHMEGLLTIGDIGIKLAKSYGWVANALRILEVQPNRIIKKVQYYKPEIANVLAQRVDNIGELNKK